MARRLASILGAVLIASTLVVSGAEARPGPPPPPPVWYSTGTPVEVSDTSYDGGYIQPGGGTSFYFEYTATSTMQLVSMSWRSSGTANAAPFSFSDTSCPPESFVAGTSTCQINISVDTTGTPNGVHTDQLDSVWTDGISTYTVSQPVTIDVEPPIKITSASLSYRAFYPIRSDGYRDTVRLSFTLSHPVGSNGSGVLSVRHNGVEVRRIGLSATQRSVTWGGRNEAGKMLSPGTYKLVLSVDDFNTRDTVERWVELRAGP